MTGQKYPQVLQKVAGIRHRDILKTWIVRQPIACLLIYPYLGSTCTTVSQGKISVRHTLPKVPTNPVTYRSHITALCIVR
jgi:hypothetical protein